MMRSKRQLNSRCECQHTAQCAVHTHTYTHAAVSQITTFSVNGKFAMHKINPNIKKTRESESGKKYRN